MKYPILLPLLLGVGLIVGIPIGVNLTSTTTKNNIAQATKSLHEVLALINTEYVDEIDPDILTNDAIQHLLSQLDPHSVYISKDEKKQANESLNGSFEGIGIEFNIFRDTLTVITPLSDGPAAKAGLQAGDKIIEIDDEKITGINLTNSEVIKRLKGPKDTKVTVKIIRKYVKGPLSFVLIRNKIPQSSVNTSYMINAEIGYIKISRFSQNTYLEFHKALRKLKDKGMKKLVLDLQDNPGGYMRQAILLADEFLPKNQQIVYTKGKNKKYDSDAQSTGKGDFESGKLVVLINEGSSSASEIVAGALQDNDRALIVGRRSYGKGLVQSPFNLSNGGELRLTVSRYYTPSGRSIQKPYNDNTKYMEDMAKRYTKGELFYADSIKFNDSSKYTTLSGRIVYGGGGIMPDYFVPLDTTSIMLPINALYNSIQEYALQFAIQKKAQLEAMGMKAFIRDFKITNTMVVALFQISKKNKIELSNEEWAKSRNMLNILLKASIARRMWGDEGFYQIYNQTNGALQEAIELLNS